MPDDYRAAVLKFVEMHANSELMGVLPEREWILRAPTLQAEAGADQQGPGRGRPRPAAVSRRRGPGQAAASRCSTDLLAGKTKFHNVFHYPTKSWGDVGIIAWLVDAAAIVSPAGAARLLLRARTRGR